MEGSLLVILCFCMMKTNGDIVIWHNVHMLIVLLSLLCTCTRTTPA